MENSPSKDQAPLLLHSRRDITQLARGMRSYLTAGDYDIAVLTTFPPVPDSLKDEVRMIADPELNFPAGFTFGVLVKDLGQELRSVKAEVVQTEAARKAALETPTYFVSVEDNHYKYDLISPANVTFLVRQGEHVVLERSKTK